MVLFRSFRTSHYTKRQRASSVTPSRSVASTWKCIKYLCNKKLTCIVCIVWRVASDGRLRSLNKYIITAIKLYRDTSNIKTSSNARRNETKNNFFPSGACRSWTEGNLIIWYIIVSEAALTQKAGLDAAHCKSKLYY